MHDYRILDHRGGDGRWATVLIDPLDQGNQLYYYDTEDPSRPRLRVQVHARWESADDGLGQVRPGGPDGKYHLVTWHCSDLYCGKNHGDSLYVLDSRDPSAAPVKIPLPMLTKGGFARDVACNEEALCIVTLTWDGLVAVDSGARDTVNAFGIIAAYSGHYYGVDSIPQHMQSLRLHSGAQKVYASRRHSRHFYVEHADFSMRPLRVGDTIRALQLTEVLMCELLGYNATVKLQNEWASELAPVSGQPRESKEEGKPAMEDINIMDGLFTAYVEKLGSFFLNVVLLVILALLSVIVVVLTVVAFRWRRLSKQQQTELQRFQPPGEGSNVVVGRPVTSSGDAGATRGEPVSVPTVVSVCKPKTKNLNFGLDSETP